MGVPLNNPLCKFFVWWKVSSLFLECVYKISNILANYLNLEETFESSKFCFSKITLLSYFFPAIVKRLSKPHSASLGMGMPLFGEACHACCLHTCTHWNVTWTLSQEIHIIISKKKKKQHWRIYYTLQSSTQYNVIWTTIILHQRMA